MGKRGEEVQANVLAVLRRFGEPASAYAVLDALRETSPKLAPTTIYRALNALTERGKVHRLESLNAFMVCQCDGHQQSSILSICDDCGSVEESIAPDVLDNLSKVVGTTGFEAVRHVIEVHGRCSDCTSHGASA